MAESGKVKNILYTFDTITHKVFNNISGIYCIKNNINNKIYVGSAKNLYHRLKSHFSALTNNCHANKKLQHAVNKYKISNFSILILEYILDKSTLLLREQHYIDSLNAVKDGYNIKFLAACISPYKQYSVISPTNEKFITSDLQQFCKLNNLTYQSMVAVATGRRTKSKNWTCELLNKSNLETITYNNRQKKRDFFKLNGTSKNYKVITPTSDILCVYNLKKFAIENGLNYHSLFSVINTNKPHKNFFVTRLDYNG